MQGLVEGGGGCVGCVARVWNGGGGGVGVGGKELSCRLSLTLSV
jgi:hypothetical protein